MRAKTLLTVLFVLALGVGGFVYLKAMSVELAAQVKVEGPEALAAATALEPRTLLRAQDVTWQKLTGAPPPGAILRPNEAQRREKPVLEEETRASVFGAVLRLPVGAGEPITTDLVVKPGDRDFLRVVLTPGQRAIAIPVKTGGASTGLLEPGDHVDVILTQKFNDKEERIARRSVAETVVEDLRVLAIDDPATKANQSAISRDFGRTVTIEVTPEQAQKVNVAAELGKLSLTLRPAGAMPTTAARPSPAPLAVWAGDVSPALGSVMPPINPVADPGIKVMRGDKPAVQVKLR